MTEIITLIAMMAALLIIWLLCRLFKALPEANGGRYREKPRRRRRR